MTVVPERHKTLSQLTARRELPEQTGVQGTGAEAEPGAL